MQNIHEMIQAHLEGEDTVTLYNLVPDPRVGVSMELPENDDEIA